MKYLPIQINQEWHLREENPYQIGSDRTYPLMGKDNITRANEVFEEKSIANAKPIINHDGREWYDETELEEVWQYWSDWEKWTNCGEPSRFKNYDEFKEYWSNGAITTKTRPAWKYIGEKPVSAIPAINGKNYPMSEIRKQNGLKRDIIELVLNVAAPDDDCMLSDFLMALQFVLDKHQFNERTRIIDIIQAELKTCPSKYFNLYEDLLTKINNNGK